MSSFRRKSPRRQSKPGICVRGNLDVCKKNIHHQGRSQGRVSGILEPPFRVMKMNIISRGKTYGNPPLEIPRDEIFVFEEEQKENQFKNASHIAGYNILRVHKLDGSYEPPVYRSMQCGNQQLSQPRVQLCARRN